MTATDELHRFVAETVAAPDPYATLLSRLGRAEIVLIGEASHGTHEFYAERAALTRRLIEEHGFAAVAVEADWPDALRVHRFVMGESDDRDAEESLRGLGRFPGWMWRNAEVLDFVGWLRDRNEAVPFEQRAAFFGLDLYSLRSSMQAVIDYLEDVDPQAAIRARQRYGCFDVNRDPTEYGYAVRLGLQHDCREAVTRELMALQDEASRYLRRDGAVGADEFFYAEQNARVARDAEEYYRTMLDADVSSWNLRDRHMFETLENLRTHLRSGGSSAKIVVWAHNSHVGNGAATEMGRRGEFNIGSLAHSRYGWAARTVGFTTYDGTVSAASDWGEPAERMRVRPALPGSYEECFHRLGFPRFVLTFGHAALREAASGPLLERAIGVIYRPETERQSHYFFADLPGQFDAVIHIDRTRAVEPLERTPLWERGEVAETFPTGV